MIHKVAPSFATFLMLFMVPVNFRHYILHISIGVLNNLGGGVLLQFLCIDVRSTVSIEFFGRE